MKCPKCGGNAELSNWGSYVDPDYADFHVECEKCGYHSMGSTEPNKAKEMFEKGMGMYYTNEDWLRQANKEQLAEFLTKFILDDKRFRMTMVGGVEETKMWLNQPHKENE